MNSGKQENEPMTIEEVETVSWKLMFIEEKAKPENNESMFKELD